MKRRVAVAFFLSGFAALLYQLVWQRALFALYGITSEAVTVVVTAFMLGLGLGNHAGGVLSSKPRYSPLALFALLELGVGLFGLASLPLFRAVGHATLHLAPAFTAALTLGLLVVPTLMMGATLPLLVSHAVRHSGNVGKSVGELYYVNTLGSAAACTLAVLVLFRWLGQSGAVHLAVACNLLVSLAAYLEHRRGARA